MIDRSSLKCVLHEISLPNKLIDWIMVFTTCVNYRFNVNDEFTSLMEAKRGIRQGEPPSPPFFL